MALFGYTLHISEVLRPDRRCNNLFNGRAQGNQGKRAVTIVTGMARRKLKAHVLVFES